MGINGKLKNETCGICGLGIATCLMFGLKIGVEAIKKWCKKKLMDREGIYKKANFAGKFGTICEFIIFGIVQYYILFKSNSIFFVICDNEKKNRWDLICYMPI